MFRILTDFRGIKGMAIPDTFLQRQIAQRFQPMAGESNLRRKDYQVKDYWDRFMNSAARISPEFAEKSRDHFVFNTDHFIICNEDFQRQAKS